MRTRIFTLFVLLLLVTRSFDGISQLNVVSSNGYVVSITAIPTAILPSTTNCPWGFNYNLRISYVVIFTGINRPASLNTLQGTIVCGGNSHFFDLPNSPGIGTVNSVSNVWRGTTDCLTSTVHTLSCTTARIEIGGPGIPSQIISMPITYSVLPVGLTEFEIEKRGGAILLKWTTASEVNNDRFAIQHSTDGVNWNEISSVSGNGTTTVEHKYSWVDEHPAADVNYYRLKQIDIDGTERYSWVKFLNMEQQRGILRIYPQPSAGNKINFTGLELGVMHRMRLFSLAGVQLWEKTFSGDGVNLPVLAKGIYFIRVSDREGKEQTVKYVQE